MNNIHVASQTSQSLNRHNCNISFGNLQSCTININTAPVPPNNSYLISLIKSLKMSYLIYELIPSFKN